MRRNRSPMRVWRARAPLLAAMLLVTALFGVNPIAQPAVAAPTSYTFGGSNAGIALSPDGKTLYVAIEDQDLVAVFDTASGNLLDKIPVTGIVGAHIVTIAGHHVPIGGTDLGTAPETMAMSHDGKKLYVGNFLGSGSDRAIAVIDTASRKVVDAFPIVGQPRSMALSPDGVLMYVASRRCSLTILDLIHGSVVAPYVEPLTGGPSCAITSVAASADGKKLYLINASDARLVTLDATGSPPPIVNSSGLDTQPLAVAIASKSSKLFVTYTSGNVEAVDPGGTILATIPGQGQRFPTLTISPDGKTGYRPEEFTNSVSVLDLVNSKVTKTIKVSGDATFSELNGAGDRLYVSNLSGGSVLVFDVSAKPSGGSKPSSAASASSTPEPSPSASAEESATPSPSAIATSKASSTDSGVLLIVIVGLLVLVIAAVVGLLLVIRRPTAPKL
jgi:DNA-binding beta-propeller fold protein YncE